MSSLVTKWKKHKPYLYWVRSARVQGQPRIVEQIYLGPRERVLEQLRTQGSVAPQPGAAPPLRTVQTRECGASTLFYTLAQDLGIVDLINAEVIKIMKRADVKEAWAKQGAVPMPMTPSAFDKFLRADIEKWAHVVKVSGAKAE